MSTADNEDDLIPVAASEQRTRHRRLRAIFLATLTAQYTLIAIAVGLSAAGTLRYLVTPKVVAQFEAIAAALNKR